MTDAKHIKKEQGEPQEQITQQATPPTTPIRPQEQTPPPLPQVNPRKVVAQPKIDEQTAQQDNLAPTLRSLRLQRQELEDKYNKGIDRHRTAIKINAVGKLITALAQLAGGGRGVVQKDSDPYQVNAWRQLDQLRAEKRQDMARYEAQENALISAEQRRRSQLELERIRANVQAEKARIDYIYKLNLNNAKSEADRILAKEKHDSKIAEIEAQGKKQEKVVGARISGQIKLEDAKQKNRETNQKNKVEGQKDVWTHKVNNPMPNRGGIVIGGNTSTAPTVLSNPYNQKTPPATF